MNCEYEYQKPIHSIHCRDLMSILIVIVATLESGKVERKGIGEPGHSLSSNEAHLHQKTR